MEDNLKSIKTRDPKYKDADVSCIQAIAQAAINVELFTIPLYMTSMYSIYGLHPIGSNDFYTGRLWPGAAPVPNPQTPNEKAFNLIFKVFIEEMLHLQLAANISNMIGAAPDFTSPMLQSPDFGWNCYNSTVIPHILDFQDCIGDYKGLQVKLDALNPDQATLFMAIEETMDDAEGHIDPAKKSKYFQPAPFDWWQPEMTEKDLPLFGSIGWMYTCFWDYLEVEYTDGTSLLEILLGGSSAQTQRDQFNLTSSGHPKKEYPGIDATLDNGPDLKTQLLNMIDAITDQGEGKGVVASIRARWNILSFQAVENQFQVDPAALDADYPGANGKRSGQAAARIDAAVLDHFEVFTAVKEVIAEPGFMTWDTWHQNSANQWTAQMLNPAGTPSKYDIPGADAVAGALNELKAQNFDNNYTLLSQAAVGTIKGITTQLNQYWQGKQQSFPEPAMYGSGDRVSICWAVTGKVPKLWEGIANPPEGVLNHACQGMDLTKLPSPTDQCAAVQNYHSCKGSNTCKTEGGCGFVNSYAGGGTCGNPTGFKWSAPANNQCGGKGGCAVPISASQLFPKNSSYTMMRYNFGAAPGFTPEPLDEGQPNYYQEGDTVDGIAWKAYSEVMKVRFPDGPEPVKPQMSNLRLAFPPST